MGHLVGNVAASSQTITIENTVGTSQGNGNWHFGLAVAEFSAVSISSTNTFCTIRGIFSATRGEHGPASRGTMQSERNQC